MFPKLTIDLKKLDHNIRFLTELCQKNGIEAAFVTKCVCADARVAALIDQSKACMVADSRIRNLDALRVKKPKLLLRVSMKSEAHETVRAADYSLQSEPSVIQALGAAARAQGKRHNVLLMIDLGDLREGVFFKDEALVLSTARAVADEPFLTLAGVGTNLTCYGSVLPSEQNLGELVRLAALIRKELNVALPIVSGGNSSSLTLLKQGRVPAGVNHLRLGESYLLGNDTASLKVVEGLYDDAFTLHAELAEVQKKPSMPLGEKGANAFGERVSYVDKGPMLRGILAIGRQDVSVDGLTPLDEGVSVLGASSDHMLVDVTNAKAPAVGSVLRFRPDYGALLSLCTSAYVHKEYIEE